MKGMPRTSYRSLHEKLERQYIGQGMKLRWVEKELAETEEKLSETELELKMLKKQIQELKRGRTPQLTLIRGAA